MNHPRTCRKRSQASHHLLVGSLLFCLTAVVPACAQRGAAPADTTSKGGEMVEENIDWKSVDQLVSEQKFQAAAEKISTLRSAARQRGDVQAWTRSLIMETQLKTGLHNHETAVRFRRDEAWPDTPREQAVLQLFYARTLVHYLRFYSWEIGQRERMVANDVVDLKAWTKDQIFAEAQRAYTQVWQHRETWGAESLGNLAEYIEQNNYPARIRGTLRDAVTYLWAELLADTSLWRPEHSNGVYRLDTAKLIDGNDLVEPKLADPDVHPLRKISAITADLESWHRHHKRPEAAFAARLERLGKLRLSLPQTDDRQALQQNLEEHLEQLGRRYEWWSLGMATLAEWVRDEDGDLVEARRLATEGLAAHPESIGGQRCRHIVAMIDAAEFSLASMAIDGAQKRSIQVTHKNLSKLYFRAYPIDLMDRINNSKDYNLLPDHRTITKIIGRQEPLLAWQTDLPETPDFQNHRTFVKPPLTKPGLYLLVASSRQDFSEQLNRRAALHLWISDLVLLTRQQDGGHEVTVRSGATGETLAGVELSFYRFDWRAGHQLVATQQSDTDGRAFFKPPSDPNRRGHNHFVVARQGEDLSLDLRLRRAFEQGTAQDHESALIYTDRSVYRPQQKVHWKVVAYKGNHQEGRFQTSSGRELTLELLDANGESVTQSTVTTNSFGSASGEMEIPAGRLLGNWTLSTAFGASTSIRVEEYKRPTFEVTLDDPHQAMRLNRAAELKGQVRYYFGLPVVEGEVQWRVVRQPIYPRWWWYPQPRGEGQTVATGTSGLEADGSFLVKFTPQADERLAATGEASAEGGANKISPVPSNLITYRYELSAEVTDNGGETRSASRAFRLGFVAVEANIEKSAGFFLQGQPTSLSIRRTDLNGNPQEGRATWQLHRLQQDEKPLLPAQQPVRTPDPDDFQTPGDLKHARWHTGEGAAQTLRRWAAGPMLRQGQLQHGEAGTAELELTDLEPGTYRLSYSTHDEFGTPYGISENFIVVGADKFKPIESTPLALAAVLLPESHTVSVGDTARFLVHSALPQQEMLFETFRGQRLQERRVLNSEEGLRLIEIPIQPEHRGGFTVRLTALRDHQLLQFTENLSVPWEDRQLQVEFATFRDRLRPGGRDTWRVTLRADDGKVLEQGAAEILAYMYDKSLDFFAPHNPPQPISLYPSRQGVAYLGSNLGSVREVWRQDLGPGLPEYPHLTADQLKFFDNYAIGGPGGRGGVQRFGAPMQRMAMKSRPGGPEIMATEALSSPASAAMDMASEAPAPSPPPPPPEPPSVAAAPESGANTAPELRSDFSETAFWHPHLLLANDGSVSFEVEVPDSVTEWNVWVHALTQDLRSGSLQKQTRTVKDLLVRPYLPRFFREGDQADLRMVINNAGEVPLSGHLDLEILDPETEESLLTTFGLNTETAIGIPFTVEPSGGTHLTFPVKAPRRVGPVAFRVTAKADHLSDGELRPLSILPSRLHLAQSRFVTLHDADRREMHFEDLASEDDPSRENEQLVVTLEAQLFYNVLHSLPYLVNYPYHCTEQTLNRFLSTGIVASLYDDFPAVARMAKEFAQRETRFESWNDEDPNRKMLLEETPWLQSAAGQGHSENLPLINVLDPKIAQAQRDGALAELRKAQTSLGAFPWWPGGPPSPYITLYLLQGFSRALEFGVDVPQDMVVKAWAYLQRHYVEDLYQLMVQKDCCWETITFLNFVLSNYPDVSWTGGVFSEDDRREMLDFSFSHWRKHSPRLKGYLALTLQRAGRGDDAELVFDSIMDSSKTTRDEGTFWAPEDRAWLWYNDTIETHAFVLRAMEELAPEDERRHGLVQWLFLNKKLNHWKSTRATAEVIYSLVHYLDGQGALGQREEAQVTLGQRRQTYTFEPDVYTGRKTQWVVEGPEVEPAMATVVVEKETPGFLFASATWHFATDELPKEARGDFFAIERTYFKRMNDGREWTLEPMQEGTAIVPGDQVEVHVSIRTKHAAEYVHLRDPRGAGFEPESTTSRYRWDLGIGWYEEVRDSGTNFFFEYLPVGEYTFKYRLRANLAGTFRVGPATIQSMYAPEFVGYSSGAELEIGGGEK